MNSGKQLKTLILLVVVLLSSSAKRSLIRPTTNPKSHSTTSGISLTKCCPPSHLYKTGPNYCRPSGINDITWGQGFLLPVLSVTTNETLFYTDLSFSNVQFQLNVDSIKCPKGFLGKTSTKFHFYEDGTLKLDLDKISYKFLPEEFCIDQTSVSSDDPLIARICIPSKCADNYESPDGIHCIRKCCPLGSVVNKTTRNCQKHSSSSSFKDDVNHQLREYRTGRFARIDDFQIADGVPPYCDNYGRQPFNMSQFYLLNDGRMYVPNFPCQSERATEEYCIDHFVYDEQRIIRLEGIRCFTNVFTSTDDSQRSLQVHPYLLLVSAFFLVAAIGVYIAIPEIRDNIHGVSTISYFACTALFYVSLAMIKLGVGLDQQKPEIYAYCKPLAICAHFYFLSTFTWLNVVGFDLWWTFKTLEPVDCKNRHHFGRRFGLYSIYAWGIPLAIVLTGQILDLIEVGVDDEIVRPKFGFSKCWFMCKEAFLVYLYIPVAVLILFNVIFFCLTAILFHQTSTQAELAVGSRNAKQRYSVIFNLFILMGVSWTTEVVSFILDGSFYSWFLTDLINSLMGFIIFVIFVCKARIGRLLVQNSSCLKKLFSSYEFVRGQTLPRLRSEESRAMAISMFQNLKNRGNELSNSQNTTHSVVLIMSNFKVRRAGTKKLLPHPSLPSGSASTINPLHPVICNSIDNNRAQSNHTIETTSI